MENKGIERNEVEVLPLNPLIQATIVEYMTTTCCKNNRCSYKQLV